MSKSGPTRYRVPAALFLHHVQGHDRHVHPRYCQIPFGSG